METFIKVTGVSYSYDYKKSWALSGIDLEIGKGEFLCILGANGSGKSTLAKHLNGLLMPDAGDVVIGRHNTRDEKNLWQIRRRVGMVFQNPDNQIVAAVVEEDVAFGLENLGLPSAEIRARVDWALKLVGMDEYRMRGPQFLSGGQKQRVSIAGIMAMQPECLVLDEPTAMLDPQGRKEVLEIVKQLNKEEGITVVLITHNMEEALLADRIVTMGQGKLLLLEGTPAEVFLDGSKLREADLEVPVMVQLAARLRENGLIIPAGAMTIDEMVEALCG
ncbi:MAG: energy-coupling factor transporter ATPase [Clostridia bacterium]|nr:energy-coupling factor transporter ATPase [Clostridia bacterium]